MTYRHHIQSETFSYECKLDMLPGNLNDSVSREGRSKGKDPKSNGGHRRQVSIQSCHVVLQNSLSLV